MRVNIKTKGKIKDPDIKALYLIHHALEISTPRMRKSNLKFVAEQFGIKECLNIELV